jgi:hypothetical protein
MRYLVSSSTASQRRSAKPSNERITMINPVETTEILGDRMNISFTNHAFKRVKQRLSLLPDAVIELLNRKLWIDVGTEEGTKRIHCLFFSPYDSACFVSILDVETEQVITILPIKYHDNLAWHVPFEKINKATKMYRGIRAMLCEMYPGRDKSKHEVVSNGTSRKKRVKDNHPIVEKSKASALKISANVQLINGMKTVNLGSVPAVDFNYDIYTFCTSEKAVCVVNQRLAEKGIDTDDVICFHVSIGKNKGGLFNLPLKKE